MLSRIQGRWVMHEVLMNGQAFEAMKGGVAEIDESTIVVESGGQKMESTFTLDESTTPIRFESVATTGMKGMAVMKFEGEELWVATALDPNAGFPVDFTAAAGVMLIKYKKE